MTLGEFRKLTEHLSDDAVVPVAPHSAAGYDDARLRPVSRAVENGVYRFDSSRYRSTRGEDGFEAALLGTARHGNSDRREPPWGVSSDIERSTLPYLPVKDGDNRV